MMKRVLLCLVLIVSVAVSPAAQQTVVIVRHAERADAGSPKPPPGADPDLSEAGQARAASLAVVLKDAGIAAIFATEFKRTQQTAAPLAKALALPVITVKSNDMASLVAQLKAAKGNALVVAHSNTIQPLAKALGIASPPAVADDEFDKMFVVTAASSPKEAPSLLMLHYR
jgi:broad specificity phosphatase PhoE